MKFLILLAFSTFAAAAFYQFHVERFESAMTKMKKAGTWEDYLKYKDAIRPTAHDSDNKYKQQIADYFDVEYSVNITIGTPPQYFTTIFDTTTSFLWVPDITCKVKRDSDCDQCMQYNGPLCQFFCGRSKFVNKEDVSLNPTEGDWLKKKKFDQKESSTYVVNGTKFRVDYNIGPIVGFLGRDTVRLGRHPKSLQIPNVLFGQITELSPLFKQNLADGFLGLAFPARGLASPFFEAIKQKLVEAPVFSIFLVRGGGEAFGTYGGLITYGGIDTKNCKSDITFLNLMKTTSDYLLYKFHLQNVKLGDFTSDEGWDAIIDTSSAYITGPSWAILGMVRAVGGYFEPKYQCFLMDCDHKPAVHIDLGIGPTTLVVQPENYIASHRTAEGKCCMFLEANTGTGFTELWKFGYPVLRSYCTIYDVGKKRIGFALPRKSEKSHDQRNV